jgi:hypothetical protein
MNPNKNVFMMRYSFIIFHILILVAGGNLKAQNETASGECVVKGRVYRENGNPLIKEKIFLACCSNKRKCEVIDSSPFGYTDEEGIFEIRFDRDYIAETDGDCRFLSLGIIHDKQLVKLKKDELSVLFFPDQFSTGTELDFGELVFEPK